jgi:hypothetical protein
MKDFIQKNTPLFLGIVGVIAATLAIVTGIIYKVIVPRDAGSYPTPTETHLYNSPTPTP